MQTVTIEGKKTMLPVTFLDALKFGVDARHTTSFSGHRHVDGLPRDVFLMKLAEALSRENPEQVWFFGKECGEKLNILNINTSSYQLKKPSEPYPTWLINQIESVGCLSKERIASVQTIALEIFGDAPLTPKEKSEVEQLRAENEELRKSLSSLAETVNQLTRRLNETEENVSHLLTDQGSSRD